MTQTENKENLANIKIKLYGVVKELIKVDHITVQVYCGVNVKEFRKILFNTIEHIYIAKTPDISEILDKSLLLLNGETITEEDKIINSSDEIALLPPFSGG